MIDLQAILAVGYHTYTHKLALSDMAPMIQLGFLVILSHNAVRSADTFLMVTTVDTSRIEFYRSPFIPQGQANLNLTNEMIILCSASIKDTLRCTNYPSSKFDDIFISTATKTTSYGPSKTLGRVGLEFWKFKTLVIYEDTLSFCISGAIFCD
ncbi:uncharacterized protein BDR25DRAFT_352515 [Lindgomyces ingoldianus]|uniref:Uncharacterized protein n=1 Tax=Lindgomyces ingoldianus TaxID=673940 RepID=A0ACB6R3E7_9PLEO|nr:uncharacterized protein BDR25DRAFT_352515 [Lindgomyces ingoldianus]KAF2473037.1 hypothetical protein BDR25DRAFT_352515 [Lindgomyces ingoldianus]